MNDESDNSAAAEFMMTNDCRVGHAGTVLWSWPRCTGFIHFVSMRSVLNFSLLYTGDQIAFTDHDGVAQWTELMRLLQRSPSA